MSWDKMIAEKRLRTIGWSVLAGGLLLASARSGEIKAKLTNLVNNNFSLTGPKTEQKPDSRPYWETKPSEDRVPFSTMPEEPRP